MPPERDDDGSLIPVATRLKLRGIGGRLTAHLVADGIDQFRGRSTVLVGRSGGPRERLRVEEYRIYGRKVILKLGGIDSADLAERLIGLDILMPCKGLVDLPEGAYYIFELVGLKVQTHDGRVLGTVRGVVETGGTPLLVIETPAGLRRGGAQEEILLPAARSICANIDIDSRCMTVNPPDGLLDLYGI